jgi:hypothetical protein
MAEEKPAGPLGGNEEPSPEPEKDKEAPAAPAPAEEFKEETQPLMDPAEFWNNIDSEGMVKVTVHTADDKPIAALPSPDEVGGVVRYDGTIAFPRFPDAGKSFTGTVRLLPGSTKETPFVSLTLQAGPIMEALASVISKYAKEGGGEARDRAREMMKGAHERLPSIFTHVFNAIKEKSEGLHWSGLTKPYEPIPVVELIYSGIPGDLNTTLSTAFAAKKIEIRDIGAKILTSGLKGGKKEKLKLIMPDRLRIVDFVLKIIPKDKFTWVEGSRAMLATMSLATVEELGGKEIVDIIKATEAIGVMKFHEMADKYIWYRYFPERNLVVFENKELTDKHLIGDIQKIWRNYGGGTPQELFKAIAGDREVGVSSVVKWFTDIVNKLSPSVKDKAADALGLSGEEGIKKRAYPEIAWAGPSLDQVGALVGDAQAKWASELAGSLAARFDYISYPKLEGGPSDLKKLATLPLSEAQRARVEKYREPAVQLMKELYQSRPSYDIDPETKEPVGYTTPATEELSMLAEDVLLQLVESTPSTLSHEEFLKELKHALMKAVTRIQMRPHGGALPSSQVSPEDILQGDNPPINTVVETPVEMELTKTALLQEEDAIQVLPEAPGVPPQYFGKLGKVVDVKADLFMCPEHGPEPHIIYLIELEGGQHAWLREDQLRTVATTN